jgi:hypothetical protein
MYYRNAAKYFEVENANRDLTVTEMRFDFLIILENLLKFEFKDYFVRAKKKNRGIY